MEIALPLSKMTIPDKLRVLEELWDSLLHSPKEVPFPAWHTDVLNAREKRIRSGEARFNDWDEAKQRIRRRVK